MIPLKCTQDKMLAVLQSVSGIVGRRHTLPCLANVMNGCHISNGFPEQGGGGESDGSGEAPAVAASDDDDGGDDDGEPARRCSSKPAPAFPPALFGFAPLSHYVGFGRSRIYQLIGAGKFPKPIKLGKSSRWLKTEIDAWIQQQAAQRVGS